MSADRIPAISVEPEPATREQVVRAVAAALIQAVAERASRTPREAAEAAYYPGHPLGSVEAIEAVIIRRRAAESGALPGRRAA